MGIRATDLSFSYGEKPHKVFLMPEAKMDFWIPEYSDKVGEI